MKVESIKFTREELEHLSSLMNHLVGVLQYGAVKTTPVNESLDESFKFWNTISLKIDSAHGFQVFMQPSEHVDNLLFFIENPLTSKTK